MSVKNRLFVVVLWITMNLTIAQAKEHSELGIVLGRPLGLSGKIFVTERNAIDIVVGGDSDGIMLHSDYLWHDFTAFKVSEGQLPFYYGAGLLITAKDFCVQGKIGLEYLFDTNPLGIFIEFAPAFGTSFISQAGVGVRYRIKPKKQ